MASELPHEASSKSIVPPQRSRGLEPAGVRRGPGVPRAPSRFRARTFAKLGCGMRRENAGGLLMEIK